MPLYLLFSYLFSLANIVFEKRGNNIRLGRTGKMLTQHLKELEQAQLISRESLPVVPPHVIYSLTRSGRK